MAQATDLKTKLETIYTDMRSALLRRDFEAAKKLTLPIGPQDEAKFEAMQQADQTEYEKMFTYLPSLEKCIAVSVEEKSDKAYLIEQYNLEGSHTTIFGLVFVKIGEGFVFGNHIQFETAATRVLDREAAEARISEAIDKVRLAYGLGKEWKNLQPVLQVKPEDVDPNLKINLEQAYKKWLGQSFTAQDLVDIRQQGPLAMFIIREEGGDLSQIHLRGVCFKSKGNFQWSLLDNYSISFPRSQDAQADTEHIQAQAQKIMGKFFNSGK